MSTDFILDFETLGKSDDSILLSVGILAIPENLNQNYNIEHLLIKSYYNKIDREEQISLGRTIDKETLEWWKLQGSSAKQVLNNENLVSCTTVYNDIVNFFSKYNFNKSSNIYSRGLIDQRWWQSFCKMLKKDDILPFYQWRDTRTLLDILVGNPNGIIQIPSTIVKHNAVHDCCLDFYRIQNAMGYTPLSDEVPF